MIVYLAFRDRLQKMTTVGDEELLLGVFTTREKAIKACQIFENSHANTDKSLKWKKADSYRETWQADSKFNYSVIEFSLDEMLVWNRSF